MSIRNRDVSTRRGRRFLRHPWRHWSVPLRILCWHGYLVAVPSDREPAVSRTAFTCPNCESFAQQVWSTVMTQRPRHAQETKHDWQWADCQQCRSPSVWRNQEMVWPRQRRAGPAPAEDFPPAVLEVYEEARDVAPISRRSAVGLLRLSLQLLVDELEPGKGSIDQKIGRLVTRGLAPQVRQAMDVLRVTGNQGLHSVAAGQIEERSEEDLSTPLFKLIHLIVEQIITRPRELTEMEAALPQGALEAIARRDGTAGAAST